MPAISMRQIVIQLEWRRPLLSESERVAVCASVGSLAMLAENTDPDPRLTKVRMMPALHLAVFGLTHELMQWVSSPQWRVFLALAETPTHSSHPIQQVQLDHYQRLRTSINYLCNDLLDDVASEPASLVAATWMLAAREVRTCACSAAECAGGSPCAPYLLTMGQFTLFFRIALLLAAVSPLHGAGASLGAPHARNSFTRHHCIPVTHAHEASFLSPFASSQQWHSELFAEAARVCEQSCESLTLSVWRISSPSALVRACLRSRNVGDCRLLHQSWRDCELTPVHCFALYSNCTCSG